jgi:hypothetical protein
MNTSRIPREIGGLSKYGGSGIDLKFFKITFREVGLGLTKPKTILGQM